MECFSWQSFKSGSDIRGIAIETPKGSVTLTDTAIEAVTGGFLLWLSQKRNKPVSALTVAVGHDSRLSADRIRNAVIRKAVESGCKVLDCGLASTPSMFMITVDHPVDGSIQITASHHPFYLNGLKFFTPHGGLEGEDIETILSFCQQEKQPPQQAGGCVIQQNYMAEYAARLRRLIAEGLGRQEEDKPLSGLHIVVDAGNGAGGFYANEVLAPLGADTSGSVFLEPDGHFPNHIPNPEAPEAMAAIRAAVLKNQADFGVIFDTDVDRAGCVDADGCEINRNRLIALAAAMVLEGKEKGIIVTDSVTSDGLKAFIEKKLHGRHYRYKRGYRNVINQAIALCEQGENAPLAIETSGHAAFRDNYFLDDGAYLMTRMIVQLVQLRGDGKNLQHLFGDLEEPAEALELRFTFPNAKDCAAGNEVLEKLEAFARQTDGFSVADDNREGIRICADRQHGNGWLLLRMSVHDPVMPLNVESRIAGGCRQILEQVAPLFLSVPQWDVQPLREYLNI